jgi:hypothetical protein
MNRNGRECDLAKYVEVIFLFVAAIERRDRQVSLEGNKDVDPTGFSVFILLSWEEHCRSSRSRLSADSTESKTAEGESPRPHQFQLFGDGYLSTSPTMTASTVATATMSTPTAIRVAASRVTASAKGTSTAAK